jgi:uncharacterized protein (DUF1684 family)
MHKYLVILFLAGSITCSSQTYIATIQSYRNNYISTHEVVKGNDRKYLRFFSIDKDFLVTAHFEKIYDAPWFRMETSGKEKKLFRIYGYASFKIKDTACRIPVYQSQELMASTTYAKYLFLPFTDKTCGEESYDNGRYIDLKIDDVEPGEFQLDFNKAYNPYCAYISNLYNCPIPPSENKLPVAIRAGEMKYGKNR